MDSSQYCYFKNFNPFFTDNKGKCPPWLNCHKSNPELVSNGKTVDSASTDLLTRNTYTLRMGHSTDAFSWTNAYCDFFFIDHTSEPSLEPCIEV